MLLLLSCLFQYLMALFTGPHSDPADTSHRDDDRCHKITAPRNGLTTMHTPSWTPVSKSTAAAVTATPTSRVKVANEILVERMRRLHDVQEKVRGRLTKLQQAIEQWQANCIMNHTSTQPLCCSDHDDSNHDKAATRLHSRLEQIVDSYSTTDSSSADELWDGSHGNIRTRRRVLRSNWDRNYAHLRSRWAWLQQQCDLVKSKLPTNNDHVISEDDHVMSHNNDDDEMSEDHVIPEHCARTEPVRLNRKRPCQLLWQHQVMKKQSTSTRWPLDEASTMWLDQSLWSINNSHSYVTQYSSVAKRQRSLSLQLGRRGYYGNSEDDRHDMESPDMFIGYHNDIGHHGNLQETESPMSYYPSMRHVTPQNRKKRSAEFDINSFVIPYSIASSVRPEKLEYKEIPTPDWRECPVVGVSQLNGFGVHGEDLSDEAFAKRHAYCEQLEQQRFLHMCAVASNKRRGSARLLSNADSVPSPSSPVPSPVVRRVPPKPDEDDTMPVVLPWPHRKFPLTEEEEATLVSSISSSPLDTPLDVFSPVESPSNNHWTIVSPLATPLATPPPLASSNHADQKSSIVLRLAKRT